MILLMQLSSSFLITWPYHRILASLTLSVMHATPRVFLMSSFLFLSLSETPSIQRSILISALSSNPSSFLVSAQVSAPYIITGLIIVLYIFDLTCIGILLSHSTQVNSLHFCQATLILLLTSCSHPPCAFSMDPRYLNVSVCFSAFPAASLIVTASATLEQTIVSVLLIFTLSPLLSSVFCQSSNRFCIPASVTSATARSSAYSRSHGTTLLICSDTASITIINSSGLRQD